LPSWTGAGRRGIKSGPRLRPWRLGPGGGGEGAFDVAKTRRSFSRPEMGRGTGRGARAQPWKPAALSRGRCCSAWEEGGGERSRAAVKAGNWGRIAFPCSTIGRDQGDCRNPLIDIGGGGVRPRTIRDQPQELLQLPSRRGADPCFEARAAARIASMSSLNAVIAAASHGGEQNSPYAAAEGWDPRHGHEPSQRSWGPDPSPSTAIVPGIIKTEAWAIALTGRAARRRTLVSAASAPRRRWGAAAGTWQNKSGRFLATVEPNLSPGQGALSSMAVSVGDLNPTIPVQG